MADETWQMARRFLVICHLSSVLLLPACGFEPVYGKHGASAPAAREMVQKIAVSASTADPERRRMAQHFRYTLEDLLNPGGGAATPEYNLVVALTMTEVPVSISRDGTVSRYNVQIDAGLTLTRAADNALIYSGTARRTGSYNNVSNAFYSTYASSEDTVNRTAQELAEDVRLRMTAFFAQHPNPAPMTPADPKASKDAPPTPPRPLIPADL